MKPVASAHILGLPKVVATALVVMCGSAVTCNVAVAEDLEPFETHRKRIEMQEVAYIAFVFAAAVIGALLGIAAHFWRAHARYLPEKLFDDSDIANEVFMDNYMFEKHAVGAEWDESGYWSADSSRNLLYYVASGFALPLILGIVFWDRRAVLVSEMCSLLAWMGLHSPLCQV